MVDELQPDLKKKLGSKAHIGSLSNLMVKMKEKRQKEMNAVKWKLQTTGHQLFAAVKEFMVMLVVEENLSLTLAAMLMTAVMSEEKTQRCSNAIVDVARQMSMVDDTDEWNAQDEDCKEGRLQVQLLSVNAGSAERKAGYARLDPSSERIAKAKSRKAKRAEVKELGTT